MVEKGADCSARLALGMNLHSARHGRFWCCSTCSEAQRSRVESDFREEGWSDTFARSEVSHTPVVLRKANMNNAPVPHFPIAVRAAVGDGHNNVVSRTCLRKIPNRRIYIPMRLQLLMTA